MRIVDRRKFWRASIVALMIIFLLWFVGRLFAWCSCSWYGYQTERPTRYAAFIGCMVEVDGKWYPRNELRVVQ